MKITITSVTVLCAFLSFFSNAQIVLQPNAAAGKDAVISSRFPDANHGTYQGIEAFTWTNSGNIDSYRGLLEFDLSSIPANAIISNATLSLYNNPSSLNAGAIHQSLSGSNAAYLEKIVQPWDEMSVTWNNQPSTTPVNRVIIPQSTSPTEDYNLDVTTLIQDAHANPSAYFGFLLKLQTEIQYRSLIFASSDNAEPSNRPKLVINYTAAGMEEIQSFDFKLYPNPVVDGSFKITLQDRSEVKVYNLMGELLFEKTNVPAGDFDVETKGWAKGTYIVELFQNDKIGKKNLIIR